MVQLHLNLLGTFEAYIAQQPLTGFHSTKARALLAFLAAEPMVAHRRSRLRTQFWGDEQTDVAAKASLRNALSNLRRVLKPVTPANRSVLMSDREIVRLDLSDIVHHIDILKFQRCVSDAQAHLHHFQTTHPDTPTYECAAVIPLLEKAVTFYRGLLLCDLVPPNCSGFEEWRYVKQIRLQQQAMEALALLSNHYLKQADPVGALNYARRQLELEPWSESAHCQMMLAYYQQGRRSQALKQFKDCASLLDTHLAVEPDHETQALAIFIQDSSQPLPVRFQPFSRRPSQPTPVPTNTTASWQRRIEARLAPLGRQKLFGVEVLRQRLQTQLASNKGPWVISLEGMGGLGKTTLADALARGFIDDSVFHDIAWISAKQTPLSALFSLSADPLQDDEQAQVETNTLIDQLLAQLAPEESLAVPAAIKKDILKARLKMAPHLVVIDNLETIVDHETLLPLLQRWSNPSKFLLTSRQSLGRYSDVLSVALHELSPAEVQDFLAYEMQLQQWTGARVLSAGQIERIYNVVGGNPLALKLVLGQIGLAPLSLVLEHLQAAKGRQIGDLYTYIYQQSWAVLSVAARQVLLSMALVSDRGMKFEHLQQLSELDAGELVRVLQELSMCSLVLVGGSAEDPQYALHQLTETFVLTEMAQWSAMS